MQTIYVHIPFCKQKCHYCSFYFSTTFDSYREKLIDALVLEILQRKSEQIENISSIYFGGGSPSLLTHLEFVKILNSIHNNYSLNNDIEQTLEINPDDITDENILIWKSLGFNRFSIGVQSFLEEDLQTMNRAHSSAMAHNAIQLIQKHNIINYSIDLMFGLPNQTPKRWLDNLEIAVNYSIPHLSCYNLTVEEKTALSNWVKRGKTIVGNDITSADLFDLTVDFLSKHNYTQYEISNYALNGFHSKHNSSYWENAFYIGFGPSAHSYQNGIRRWNVSNNMQYIHAIYENLDYFELEFLTEIDIFNEYLLTQLRTIKGLNIEYLKNRFPNFYSQIESKLCKMQLNGLVTIEKNIVLTHKGKLIADDLTSDLMII
jgi:oxygen-independent coproporphyrinogen-3 oxidase